MVRPDDSVSHAPCPRRCGQHADGFLLSSASLCPSIFRVVSSPFHAGLSPNGCVVSHTRIAHRRDNPTSVLGQHILGMMVALRPGLHLRVADRDGACFDAGHVGMARSLTAIPTTVSVTPAETVCMCTEYRDFHISQMIVALNGLDLNLMHLWAASHDRYPWLWCGEEASGKLRDPCWQGDI